MGYYKPAHTRKTEIINEKNIIKQPWMTNDILESIKTREKLHRKPHNNMSIEHIPNIEEYVFCFQIAYVNVNGHRPTLQHFR